MDYQESFNPPSSANEAVTLPIRCGPKSGEGYFGFVLRLAEANLYDTPSWILNFGNGKFVSDRPNSAIETIPAVSQLASVPPEDLRAICPIRHTFWSMEILAGKFMSSRFYRRKLNYICPECIEDFQQTFVHWDIHVVQACPIHGVLLIGECDQCGEKLTYRRSKLGQCKCGFEFIEGNIQEASGELTLIANLIASRLYSGEAWAKQAFSVSSSWENTSFEEVLDLIGILCRLLSLDRGDEELSAHFFYQGCPRLELLDLFTQIGDILANWPQSLHSVLDYGRRITEVNAQPTVLGHIRVFRLLYNFTKDRGHTKGNRILKEALAEYVDREAEQFLLTNRGNSEFLKALSVKKRTLSKESTCSSLGISSETFFRLFRQGVLNGTRVKKGALAFYEISEESVSSYKEVRRHYATKHQLNRELGVGRAFFEKLLHHKAIVGEEGPSVDGAQKWKFSPLSKKRLFDQIEGHLRPFHLPRCRFINFVEAYKYSARRKVGNEKFINAVLTGQIRARGVDEVSIGLNRFLFCQWDIYHSVMCIREGTCSKYVSDLQAEQWLHISAENLANLLGRNGVRKLAEASDAVGEGFLLSELVWIAENFASARHVQSQDHSSVRFTSDRWGFQIGHQMEQLEVIPGNVFLAPERCHICIQEEAGICPIVKTAPSYKNFI